jgi:acyl-CoA reductase-like NAD-dependent aldehyde dehydrogenase
MNSITRGPAGREGSVACYSLWVGGVERAASSGATFERINPFDGSAAGIFANAGQEDAELALAEARAAFDRGPWPRSSARARYEVLMRAARFVESNAAAFAERMVLESGKPVRIALGEVQGTVKVLEYYAGAALSSEGRAISDRTPDAFGLVLHEPIGVAALITPWNFPLLNPIGKIAPALAAGCTVVIKPSHLCPGPAVLLGRCFKEAGLPDGVLSVLTSDIERGAVVGQAMAGSPLVDKIAFTGSTGTGRAVMRAAAANNTKVALELGGKSANIVFDDAPFDAAAATAISAFCFNSGQQCSAGTRLLVQRSIYDRFLAAVVQAAGRQVLGDPRKDATSMGPLVNAEQHRRVAGYIEIGKAEGRLVTGGAPVGGDLFVAPTIFGEVDNAARIAQEEIFGPVLAVTPFDTEEEAIQLANDSPYGLAGGVWSNSINRAIRVVKGVRTGKMFVNSYNSAGVDDMPHGGYKGSGIGREFGPEGLREFQQVKTVQIKIL